MSESELARLTKAHPFLLGDSQDGDTTQLLVWAASRLSKDPGHDIAHSLRVAENMLRIDPQITPRVALAAGLLHDIVNLPKDSERRAQASSLSADVALKVLPEHGFDAVEVERIASAILTHSYSRGLTPKSPLGEALQDADRLEALGALGLMRTFSTGAKMGARYFHSSDPWAITRQRDDLKFTIDHFFTKLLNLPKTMRTAYGRQEATRRAAYMRGFLDQLAIELGVPIPKEDYKITKAQS